MKKIYSVVRKLKRFVIPAGVSGDPVRCILFFSCLFFLSSCAMMPELRYPPNRWLRDEDRDPITKPKAIVAKKHGDNREGEYFYQIEQLMKLTENLSDMVQFMAPGGSKEALNTNNFDEVADSEWFTNRIGRFDMTPDEVRREGATTGPDRSSSAGADEYAAGHDLIAQRILYLAGYNVPEAAISYPNSGKTRAIAYKWPEGEVVGPFLFHGKRKGDANDRIPHEYRRELRGYRIFCEFLGRTDPKNTLPFDVFIPYGGGKGYIKHYLVNMILPKNEGPKQKEAFKIVPSPSLDDSSWARARKPGNIEKETEYDPGGFKAYYFNLAFQAMTQRDAFWAAKILSKFTDENIAAIVGEAKFTDPQMTKKAIADMISRRDSIVNYWFSKVAPLDNFEVQNGGGSVTITFDDLSSGAEYKYQLSTMNGNANLTPWIQSGGTKFDLSEDVTDRMKQNRIYMLKIMVKRPKSNWWQSGVSVFVKKDRGLEVVGIRRGVKS